MSSRRLTLAANDGAFVLNDLAYALVFAGNDELLPCCTGRREQAVSRYNRSLPGFLSTSRCLASHIVRYELIGLVARQASAWNCRTRSCQRNTWRTAQRVRE
jgi:hypothetical protein